MVKSLTSDTDVDLYRTIFKESQLESLIYLLLMIL